MSYPLVIRLMIAMTLMPDASCCEALACLAGLLADVPFALEWHIPTGKVITGWRLLIPADVMESIFWTGSRAAHPPVTSRRRCCWPGMMVLRRGRDAGERPGHARRTGRRSAARVPRSRTAMAPPRSRRPGSSR